MIRSGFFAMGLFVCLCGATFLSIDRIIFDWETEPAAQPTFRGLFTSVNQERKHELAPPDWAAFSLMSIGSVTMLYAAALPKKQD